MFAFVERETSRGAPSGLFPCGVHITQAIIEATMSDSLLLWSKGILVLIHLAYGVLAFLSILQADELNRDTPKVEDDTVYFPLVYCTPQTYLINGNVVTADLGSGQCVVLLQEVKRRMRAFAACSSCAAL